VSRNVGQFIIKVLEVFNPMGLATSDLLGLMEVLEVLVVSMNLNRVCHSEEQGATTLEPKDNCSKFLVMGIIVLFSREETS
jgi:hypothetical protein